MTQAYPTIPETKGVKMAAPMTGFKVLMIAVAAFGIIISVNVFMAFKAISTFPGLEVDNSYVASQSFDADRAAQEALGWNVAQVYDGTRLTINILNDAGQPAPVASLEVLVGRKTSSREDQRLDLGFENGSFTAPVSLGKGAWLMHVDATAEDGTRFKQRLDFVVKG
ncbi:FixH family protein [Albirhodobacter sp. R86504]|jgi:nitrogen fixation protein FixH|uniref:FixH family protein n=1 Tax=Albirhodobacter sp. R86504 TaxID=3093848 RepID=UPI0036735C54